jgi:hypothetical protein
VTPTDDPADHRHRALPGQLAAYFPNDMDAYYDVKDPAFDLLMAGAEDWAAMVGWSLPPSD